jgi:hypothetical protein
MGNLAQPVAHFDGWRPRNTRLQVSYTKGNQPFKEQ